MAPLLRYIGYFSAEGSEASKLPSEARLIKYISTNFSTSFRLGTYKFPPGSRPKHLKTRPKAEFDGVDGVSKVSFNILHTFYVYRKSI